MGKNDRNAFCKAVQEGKRKASSANDGMLKMWEALEREQARLHKLGQLLGQKIKCVDEAYEMFMEMETIHEEETVGPIMIIEPFEYARIGNGYTELIRSRGMTLFSE